MNRRIASLLLFIFVALAAPRLGQSASSAPQLTLTDFAGRQVTMPARAQKVYCVVVACSWLVYSLDPDRLVAWPGRQPQLGNSEARSQSPRVVQQSPGGLGELNAEALLNLHPDVILYMDSFPSSITRERIERLHQQTGLPVFYISMQLQDTPAVYERLGKILGLEKRASVLAKYCRDKLNEIDSKIKTVPMNKRPRVYYAGGLDGLETVPAGEPHIAAIEGAGGVNVVNAPVSQMRLRVSMEQLLLWNPDIIIESAKARSESESFYDSITRGNSQWAQLRAVRNHAVYTIPIYSFSWASPMASVNRVLGALWLAQILHPDLFHEDIRQEARRFYQLFFHKQLTEEDLNGILLHATR